MADGVIKVSVSANKKNSVTVSSNKNNTEITATADAGRFWAQTAKNWAVSDVLVDNTDYSAKYYAQQSSMSENNAKNHAETTQQIYNQFLDVVDTSTNNFLNTKEEALEDLENAKTETLATIQAKSNEGVESIENEANNSLEELISLKNSTLNEVNNTKIEATSSITTLSNDYISQINTTGKSYNTLTNKQITNCILEIPQRIKYTLEDGTLTIKAGSVVIVPYGNEDLTSQYPIGTTFLNDNFKVVDTQFADGKFFVWIEAQNDMQGTADSNTGAYIEIRVNNNHLRFRSLSDTTFNYDTTKNLVIDSDETTNVFCLPLGICTITTTGVSTINQIFNGIGYIGSTVWVDKGVKGLIPNGRNEDGTLNNIEFVTDRIAINTTKTTNSVLVVANTTSINQPSISQYSYNQQTNYNEYLGKNVYDCIIGQNLSDSSGKIISFQPKQPFRAVDYSDKPEVSGWSMPSSKPIKLSWGAFGTEYTAPCNGFFETGGRINNNGYIALWNKTTDLGGKSCSSIDKFLLSAWIFANKGDVVQLQYVNYVSDGGIRFFPCVGCESEV